MDEDAPCGARAPLCRCVSDPWPGRGAYVYNLKHVVIIGIYISKHVRHLKIPNRSLIKSNFLWVDIYGAPCISVYTTLYKGPSGRQISLNLHLKRH